MRRLAAAFLGAAVAAGCSGVIATGVTGATSGSGGAATTGTTAIGTGGTSGTGGGLVGSGGGTTTAPTCNDPTVFFDIEGDGPLQHFDMSCAPDGYVLHAGGAGPPPPPPPPPPTGWLVLEACPKGMAITLSLQANDASWPATGTIVSATYMSGGIQYQLFATGTVDVVTFGAVGEVIEGTFSAGFASTSGGDAGATLMLTGKFRVCRGPDVYPV